MTSIKIVGRVRYSNAYPTGHEYFQEVFEELVHATFPDINEVVLRRGFISPSDDPTVVMIHTVKLDEDATTAIEAALKEYFKVDFSILSNGSETVAATYDDYAQRVNSVIERRQSNLAAIVAATEQHAKELAEQAEASSDVVIFRSHDEYQDRL